MMELRNFLTSVLIAGLFLTSGCKSEKAVASRKPSNLDYRVFKSFDELTHATNVDYPMAVRVTQGGSKDNPKYHGFWFYNCAPKELLAFDPSGRYMVVMRVHVEGRPVLPTDEGEIGIIDLQDNNKWKEIGTTTAWNWQQGNRLQWIPGSDKEIIWNDRADDGQSYVSRIYNMETQATRTLPRPIYVISPDGKTAPHTILKE